MNEYDNLSSRSFVIEMSVKIEHLLNLIISELLGVNSQETRSFGNSNHALSFNAKANLLLDLNYLDKDQRYKYQIFMEIRNKFAHLYSVDTFEKCFALIGNYNKLKRYYGLGEKKEFQEKDLEYLFTKLSIDISNILKHINDKILNEMALKYSNRIFSETITYKREEYITKNPSNADAVKDFISYIKEIIIKEIDDKIENNTPPHI